MALQQLSFLVLGPVLQSRTKLREVLRTCVHKSEIKHDRTLAGVADKLAPAVTPQKIDVLFIASSFGIKLISDFLAESRARQALLPPIVIFIDDKRLEKSAAITSLYLDGIDGFISEPYSADQLLGLIQTLVSKGVQVLSSEVKTKRASEFLVTDARSKIDELAVQQLQGEESGGYALKELQQLSKKLEQVVEQDPSQYADIVAKVFENAKPASEALLRKKASNSQKRLIHPAAVIRDIMRSRKITMERLVSSMRSDPAEIELLMKEERSVDEKLAKDLSRALGMTWVEWIRIQKDYDALLKKRTKKR